MHLCSKIPDKKIDTEVEKTDSRLQFVPKLIEKNIAQLSYIHKRFIIE